MTSTRPTSPASPGRTRLGWVLGLTSTAYFMVVLDSSVVLTALPRMQRDLHAGLASLQWTVNAYGIAFAAGIITAAALGDRFGRRRVFNIGLALFTVASAACALAPDAGRAGRRADRAGARRRGRPAAQPDHLDRRVPAAAARADRRHLRRPGRARGRGRPAGRRRGHRGPGLALDLLAERPDRPDRDRPRGPAAPGEPRRAGPARPARRHAGHRPASSRSCGRWCAPATPAGQARRSSPRCWPDRSLLAGVRRLGEPGCRAAGSAAAVPQPGLRGRQRHRRSSCPAPFSPPRS